MSTALVPSIRLATIDDAPALGTMMWNFEVEFDVPCDPADVLAARFARILAHEGVFALIAGQEHGFALITLRPAIWFDGPVAQLEELYVIPSRRDRGIGTALLRTARTIVRERGGQEMHINVDEVDSGARRFYERHGFVNVEADGEADDVFRMLCYVGSTYQGPPRARSTPST
ncbi:MAG: GNAT family N-acetyltransferase [Austwickia sp.]|jgi:GNAT superfamily N-acetyltransferase|nr:GNAT family N-acetyltransferase [Austwickia sp.]MBK8435433.1 GNAT family N-acetyltransferase [Austwickia sp.]MBK9101018.1 GNAT family N-acetyltransferase [Austwickia sp.]